MLTTEPAPSHHVAPLQLVARDGTHEDENFVFNSWLECYRRHSDFTKHICSDVFFPTHRRIIAGLLNRGARVRIAHVAGDPDTILGYAVTEPQVLHFVYVKLPFRRSGVARTCLDGFDLAAPFHYTHRTDETERLLRRAPGAIYNPYAI